MYFCSAKPQIDISTQVSHDFLGNFHEGFIIFSMAKKTHSSFPLNFSATDAATGLN